MKVLIINPTENPPAVWLEGSCDYLSAKAIAARHLRDGGKNCAVLLYTTDLRLMQVLEYVSFDVMQALYEKERAEARGIMAH